MNKSYIITLSLIIFLLISIAGCTPSTPAIQYGSISVNSTPTGARVILDALDTGEVTPVILVNIETGTHDIRLNKFHYKIWQDIVTVAENQTTYLGAPLIYASTQTITLQPGIYGKDAAINSSIPAGNFGSDPLGWVGDSSSAITRLYIRYDLSSVPVNAKIVNANLVLYQDYTFGENDFAIGLHKINDDWNETTINWDLQPTSSLAPISISNITAGAQIWKSWNIADLVQSWLNGDITNHGAVLKDTDETSGNTTVYFNTSDYFNSTYRPKLEIDYYSP